LQAGHTPRAELLDLDLGLSWPKDRPIEPRLQVGLVRGMNGWDEEKQDDGRMCFSHGRLDGG
jgi:hypothetical protein